MNESILLSDEKVKEAIGLPLKGFDYSDCTWVTNWAGVLKIRDETLRHALEYLNEACGKHRLVAHSEGEKHIHEFEHRYLCPACMEEINKVVKE